MGNSISQISDHYSDSGYNKVFPESFHLTLIDLIGKGLLKPKQGVWNRVHRGMPFGDRFKTPDYGIGVDVTSGNTKLSARTADGLIAAIMTTGIEIKDGKDGYYDSDGFVAFDSGHGLTLGTGRTDYFSAGPRGSWYRIYGSNYGSAFPWDYDNHRSITFNPGTAAFVHNYILADGGPYARSGPWSSWNKQGDRARMPPKKVWIEITNVKDTDSDIDQLIHRDADFFVETKIGDGPWQKSSTYKNKQSLYSKHFQEGKQYIWHFGHNAPQGTILPVVIRVSEADTETPDDLCSASAKPYLEEVVIYVDTQHGKVYGEVEGDITSDVFYTKGDAKSTNNVDLGFRIRLE